MAINKTSTLTLRIEPNLKEALRQAAATEHRSIANMVEVMILTYCEQKEYSALGAAKTKTSGSGSND